MKNPHAVAIGTLGGAAGGRARARNLSPEQLSAIGTRGIRIRWARHRGLRYCHYCGCNARGRCTKGCELQPERLEKPDVCEECAQWLGL